MIRDRYDPVNLFRLVPQLQLEMEPTLAQLDHLLDDDVLFGAVKADLSRRYPHSTRCGRRSTPVEVMLRMLVLKHLYHWSYEATEQFVNDSLILRQFCRLGLHKAPDDTTLLRWANLIQPPPARVNDRVVVLAQTHRVTRGRKLRVDGTVVETISITRPTAACCVTGAHAVPHAWPRQSRGARPRAWGTGLPRPHRRAAARHIQQTTRQRGNAGNRRYGAQQVVDNAQRVQAVLTQQAGRTAQRLARRWRRASHACNR